MLLINNEILLKLFSGLAIKRLPSPCFEIQIRCPYLSHPHHNSIGLASLDFVTCEKLSSHYLC